MKLIFIYGPPASGKLTIAEIVSARTGIPLFHNHISRDLVKDIYGDELEKHYALVRTIRLDVIEYCAKNNTDILFTYVYGGQADDANVKEMVETTEENGGEVIFVELTANREDLISRVDNESRKRFKKLSDPVIMTQLTKDMGVYAMPYVDALKIDTSSLAAEQSAELIIDRLGVTLSS